MMKRLGWAVLVLTFSACGGAMPSDAQDDLTDHGGPSDLADDEVSAFSQDLGTAPVLVNECQSGTGGYIELINPGSKTVDLYQDPTRCFFVDDKEGGATPKLLTDSNVHHAAGSTTCSSAGRGSACGRVAPGERVWLAFSSVDSVNADACRLLSSGFSGGVCGTTRSDLNAGGSTTGAGSAVCYGRSPDASAWLDHPLDACTPNGGVNAAQLACTPGGEKPGSSCDDGNKCTLGEQWSSTCQCGGGAPVLCVDPSEQCKVGTCATSTGSCLVEPKPDGTACTPSSGGSGACVQGSCQVATQGPLVINEFLGGNGGWVEIYNPASTPVAMDGWQVDDAAGGSAPKTIAGNNQIAAQGTMLVFFSGINVASADQIRLINPSGVVVDSHDNYYSGSSISGKCFGRRPSGGAWSARLLPSCTPNAANQAP
ncbi:MAG: lamin tail domain-containing protein [Myxococcaceae bacterium]